MPFEVLKHPDKPTTIKYTSKGSPINADPSTFIGFRRRHETKTALQAALARAKAEERNQTHQSTKTGAKRRGLTVRPEIFKAWVSARRLSGSLYSRGRNSFRECQCCGTETPIMRVGEIIVGVWSYTPIRKRVSKIGAYAEGLDGRTQTKAGTYEKSMAKVPITSKLTYGCPDCQYDTAFGFVDITDSLNKSTINKREKMTTKKFLEKLGKTAEFFGSSWTVDYGGFRLSPRAPFGECYCPITAVVKMETGYDYEITDAKRAGKELGLKSEQIEKIMVSADFYTHPFRRKLQDTLKFQSLLG